jgi:hypothetical protein
MKKMLVVVIALLPFVASFWSSSADAQSSGQSVPATSPAKPANPPVPAAEDQAPAAPTPYKGKVLNERSEGNVVLETIGSKYPCKTEDDCTQTKYANAPKAESECTCAAACTPFVVNKREKTAREDSNKKLCKVHHWYGPNCPAPGCKFDEFEEFDCVKGLCEGVAEGSL